MWLTKDEIRELTGFVHRDKQVEELNRLGVTHRTRGDGTIVVARDHVAEQFGCNVTSASETQAEPNWSNM